MHLQWVFPKLFIPALSLCLSLFLSLSLPLFLVICASADLLFETPSPSFLTAQPPLAVTCLTLGLASVTFSSPCFQTHSSLLFLSPPCSVHLPSSGSPAHFLSFLSSCSHLLAFILRIVGQWGLESECGLSVISVFTSE